MRTRLGAAALATWLLLLPLPSAQAGGYAIDDWQKDESSWRAFGVGTMTHTRTTSTMDIPGMPAGRKVVFEERRTLTAKDDTKATISVERRVGGGTWEQGAARSITEPLQGSAERTFSEDKDAAGKPVVEPIVVEGQTYPCTRYTGTLLRRNKKEEARFWVHPKQGVLKYEGALAAQGGRKIEWTVTRLAVTRTVGAHTLQGRQVALRGKGITGTLVLSADVPGQVVEHVMNFNKGGTRSVSRRELIAFTKK